MDVVQEQPAFDPSGFWTSDPYVKLVSLGDALWPATQYGNRFVVDDPLSMALLGLGLAAYHQAVAPCTQLEEALYFLRALNTEYPHCVIVRSYIEHVARCHKATTIGRTWASDRNDSALSEGARRITAPHKVNQQDGFNILTLITSLHDLIPDARKNYDILSEYGHGDFTRHALNRKMSYLVAKKKMVSPTITQWDGLLEQLRSVLYSDVDWLIAMLRPFIDRMTNNASKDSN